MIAAIYVKSGQEQANARLIAAAPDLLETLRIVRIQMDDIALCDRIDRVIAKATQP